MKAALYDATGAARDVLKVTETERPEPGPGQVRVRVHASGINPPITRPAAGRSRARWTASRCRTRTEPG